MQPPRDNNDERQAMPQDPSGPMGAERLEVDEPLKCVWSGFPHYDRSCRSRIPASVVRKAWGREMQLKGVEEGFFYFSWRSGVWLAYGLRDGGVRGVYCPTHCSERDSRETPVQATPTDRPVGIALQ
jgi:hypothetical protein